jgi:glycosyltransferase involved in cell wall biosynthesis
MHTVNPQNPYLSIVIPVFNEEKSIAPLYKAIRKSLKFKRLQYEIIIIDDGSRDNTFNEAWKIATEDPDLKIIKLNNNFGQTAALSAGIENAKGKLIVTMDGDLQNDPEDINRLLSKITEGYDIVLGWRENRKDDLFLRKIPSKIANSLIRQVTGTKIKDAGCSIRVCRSEIIKQFHIYSDMHRYLPVIAAMTGAKMTQIEVKHHSRQFGVSKYGLSRVYKVLLDLIALKIIWAGFHMPLYGFGVGAIAFGFFSLLAFSLSIINLFLNPGGSIVIISGISMLCGALSLFLVMSGFICDMIYRTSNLKIEDILKTTKSVEVIF